MPCRIHAAKRRTQFPFGWAALATMSEADRASASANAKFGWAGFDVEALRGAGGEANLGFGYGALQPVSLRDRLLAWLVRRWKRAFA